MNYLVIYDSPPILLYQRDDKSVCPEISIRYPLLDEVGKIYRELNDETPNITVSLTNLSGSLTEMFADPPLGLIAEVYSDQQSVFRGVIDSIELGSKVTFGIIS